MVAHAFLDFYNRKEKCIVPIIPLKHGDPQFGVEADHYHIDGRFDYKEAVRIGKFTIVAGMTSQVVIADEEATMYHNKFRILEIKFLKKKCLRKETGIPPDVSMLYEDWYNKFLGKSCAGKKCPHFGTQMITVNGKTYCPLHGLYADPETLVVVNPY